MDLPPRIRQTLRDYRLLQQGDKVIVATSGGADSTALLSLLCTIDFDLKCIAVYVDHGLRPHETGDERQVIRRLSAKLNIDFLIREVNVREYKKIHSCSTEEAARHLRYGALKDVRKEYAAAAIAVAHTADDQVEEFFIRLIRGSGIKGLSGMAMKNGHIIRPLLNIYKSELLKYLRHLNQEVCHDSSNDSPDFLRNRVRTELLPLLEKSYNPSQRATILQTMDILREEDNLLDAMTMDALKTLSPPPCTQSESTETSGISCDQILQHHPALQRRIFEQICWKLDSRPTYRKIKALMQLIKTGNNGSRLHFSKGLRVSRDRGRIFFNYPEGRKSYRGEAEHRAKVDMEIPGPGTYVVEALHHELTIMQVSELPDTESTTEMLYVQADSIVFPLRLRSFQPGEKMRPMGAPGRKKIARILSDMKIPAGERHYYLLLISGDDVVALIGAKIDERFRIRNNNSKILAIRWQNLPIA